jgi:hypothetical protein
MKNKNKIEDELDAIRLDLYEKTKGMSPAEINAYIKEKTAPINAKLGITPVSSAPPRGPEREAI